MMGLRRLPRFMIALVVSVAFTSSLVVSGCGSKSASPAGSGSTSAPAPTPLKLKSADVVAMTSPYTTGMNQFAKLMQERTNGRIQITHFPAGQLGNDAAIVEGIKLGTIDIGMVGTVASKVTDALYLPFLFEDSDHMWKVLNGEIGDQLKARFEKEVGIKLVGYVYFAPRVLTTKTKPIKTPKELKGLKIRVPLIPPMVSTWKALGASPTPLAFTELFTALQQGTVDGQENPLEIIYNNSFFEVQKYVIETNHALPVRFLVTNNDVWNKLSREEQKVFLTTWQEVAASIEEEYKKNEDKWRSELKSKGMIFVHPDVAAFREATKDVWKEFAPAAWGDGVYEKIQALRKNK